MALMRSASSRQPVRRSAAIAEIFRQLGPLFFVLFCVSLAFNVILTLTNGKSSQKHSYTQLSWMGGTEGEHPTAAMSPEGAA